MRELRDDVTLREQKDALSRLFAPVADFVCGRGYRVEVVERFTAEVIPQLEGTGVPTAIRCFAHE
jgi:hypothetical protein